MDYRKISNRDRIGSGQDMYILRYLLFPSLLMIVWALVACGRLDLSFGELLTDVQIEPAFITPNADGVEDATEIRYTLRRTANLDIFFENEQGERFYFRRDRRRSPGDYRVLWGGVIDEPRTVQTDYGPQEILSTVLPDGVYTWTIQATGLDGSIMQETGQIKLENGEHDVPELHNFAVIPDVFRPNQDGLRDDWVSISYYLTKDVDSIQLYLVDPVQPDLRYPVSDVPGVAKPTEKGYHEYRYEAGVDLNAEPPPDGEYAIVGEARDAAGNAVRVERSLTIEEGGKPRADIAQGEIQWSGEMNRTVSIPLGESLCFEAVVTNEGTVPIRTTGPWPSQAYRFSENYNTLAAEEHEEWFQQSGVWRFGINFDTTGIDFPFRWAIGRPSDLERRIIDDDEQWYLLPGNSGQVSGCIVMDEAPPVGTNFWWAGLIHEFVGVPNNYVDRITVDVGTP